MITLENIVISPTLPAKSAVIWLHGLGADGHDFVDIVPELKLPEELAIRFIFPHAPVRPVSLNGGLPMRAWFDLYGLHDESHIDRVGLAESEKQLHQLIQQEHHAGIPLENIILAGFSQGGALALHTGLHYPRRLGGILALSAFLPASSLDQTRQPEDVPICMMHGTEDGIVVLGMAEASRDVLQSYGYSVEWHDYPMAHGVCEPELRDISKWLQKTINN